jgi:hypothetical protein
VTGNKRELYINVKAVGYVFYNVDFEHFPCNETADDGQFAVTSVKKC